MKFKTNELLDTQTITQLPNGDFLLVLESGRSDDDFHTSAWSHYNPKKFEFSNNIQIVAATSILGACAVIVRKIDPAISEQFSITDPDAGNIDIDF